MGRLILWLIILAFIGGTTWGVSRLTGKAKQAGPNYNTVPVRAGDLVSAISATGTVEPEDLIDVGAQVAGRILEFGRDSQGRVVDYGSPVKANMVLARIDDAVYLSGVKQSEAALASAKATLERAKADMGQLKAKLNQARRDWERAQRLGPSDALARSSYDAYQSGYETAEANLKVGEAAIEQAQAGIAQAQADLDRARQNLGYCTIASPVDGVIIDRRVNIGQTVVASLNAPSLFLIAKDLRRVQVWVAVNEADIGNIHPGQTVSFTVDAYPNEKFQGKVGKIRLNAGMTQNVVTYTVEVTTDNTSGRLLPYLTANVQFETARHDNVLMVPNAALRWSPPAATEGKTTPSRRAGAKPDTVATQPAKAAGKGTVWVLENGQPKSLAVTVGISDGIDTEVSGPELKEGQSVITGIRVGEVASTQGTASPFVPQIRRGGGGGGRR